MPRNNTCRSSECAAGVNDNNNANDNDNCNGDGDQANGQQHDGIVATTATVKQEFDAAPPVCHRKSERRKIARDIFLVFEEQPSSRRRRGRGGARGKCTRAKQKFGHLSVAKTPMRSSNTNNNNSGISGSSSNNNNNNKSSVLREIKTEPKCSTAAANVSATASAAATATTTGATATEAITGAATGATAAVTNATATSAAATAATAVLQQLAPEKPPAKMATVKLETKTASNATIAATATVAATTAVTAAATVAVAPQLSQSKQQLTTQQTPPPEAERCGESAGAGAAGRALAATPTTPSVNPIFLWVKQDDTRIVEVRCEDYDKRNRIRLTKTTNGWRSMPRTDASSSRIVKFFHSGVAQVKREKLQQQQSMEQEEELVQKEQQHHNHHHQLEEEEQQMTHNWSVVQEDEEHHHQQQHLEQQQLMEEEQQHLDKQPALIESVVVVPAQQQQQSLEEATPDFDALLDSETNASTKATKTSTTNSSNPNTPTYQSTPSSPAPMELQLCPKTGLFLPQGVAAELPHNNVEEEEEEEQEQQADVATQDVELEQPKNLKDLLDDADDLLLQQCSSDNGSNNGVELLDSLVKRSCEDNLQSTTTTTTMATTTGSASGLSAFCVPDVAGKDLPSILGMDSSSMDDAPKCLSFNEAGEIEGLHGDLFLGIDAFDKQPETATEATPATATEVEAEAETAETATRTELVDAELETEAEADAVVEKSTQPTQHVVTADETPKDLSYKKREEVCPPSESRSQCAVTSSSDILKAKSPELPELPAVASSIPAEVETTSETIKNLILEQFLKLNGGAGGGNSQQQAEPMDLGKANARVGAGGDEKLHTVVIDDEDEEEAGDADLEPTEPLRKRAKPIKMDKDPDALTQLKMLISNPQWKVPDPILVPKDRLGAVLASPAREIPLLLTTRPELRLPEAFAYPEIIQNPNILVVTMEQLEAILKNEAEQSKTTPSTPAQLLPLPLVQQLPSSKATASPSLKQQQQQQHKQQPPSKTLVTATPPPPPPATTAAASSSPAADSSMSTELNATTLALLQQMLWLPYFGQLSQEFFKTLKDPLGLQRKFMSNLLPLYNSQFGLQHLDELYKHCLKQKPVPEAEAPPAAAAATVAPTATAAVAASSPATPTKPPAAFNGFSSPMELAFMQKLLQQQQQQQQQQQPQQSKATPQQQLHLEHKRARREHDHVAKATPPAVTPTVAAVPSAAPPSAAAAAAPAVEHKPRLTCKSLSNLLEPESNVVPLLNVPFDALRRSAAMHNSHNKPASSQDAMMSSGRQLRSSKACVTYNPLEQQSKQSQQQQQMQRKRGNMLAHELQQQHHQQQQQQQQQQHHQQQQQHLAEAAAAAAAAGGAGLDANAALWHPLFGSNPKQGYNSPWQWTTVTATGE